MLKQRVITALIALPLVLIPFLLEQLWLLIPFFCACVGLSTYEMSNMIVPRLEAIFTSGHLDSGRQEQSTLWMTWLAVIVACVIFLGAASDPEHGRGVIIAGFLGVILLGCFLAANNDQAFGRVVGMLTTIAYGTLPWLAIWELYLMGAHSGYIILMMSIVWGGDTGAYFGGKKWGRTKLMPRMSPKKTVEGAVFGIFGSVALGCLANVVWMLSLGGWKVIIVTSIIGGIFGQLGDLVESTFKRFALVKDSGNIFPGHGGFLDRVDGLLFAAPVIWFTLYIMHT